MGEIFARYPNENDPPRLLILAESYCGKMNQIGDQVRQDFVKTFVRIRKQGSFPMF